MKSLTVRHSLLRHTLTHTIPAPSLAVATAQDALDDVAWWTCKRGTFQWMIVDPRQLLRILDAYQLETLSTTDITVHSMANVASTFDRTMGTQMLVCVCNMQEGSFDRAMASRPQLDRIRINDHNADADRVQGFAINVSPWPDGVSRPRRLRPTQIDEEDEIDHDDSGEAMAWMHRRMESLVGGDGGGGCSGRNTIADVTDVIDKDDADAMQIDYNDDPDPIKIEADSLVSAYGRVIIAMASQHQQQSSEDGRMDLVRSVWTGLIQCVQR